MVVQLENTTTERRYKSARITSCSSIHWFYYYLFGNDEPGFRRRYTAFSRVTGIEIEPASSQTGGGRDADAITAIHRFHTKEINSKWVKFRVLHYFKSDFKRCHNTHKKTQPTMVRNERCLFLATVHIR
jgi:hypothetical protein